MIISICGCQMARAQTPAQPPYNGKLDKTTFFNLVHNGLNYRIDGTTLADSLCAKCGGKGDTSAISFSDTLTKIATKNDLSINNNGTVKYSDTSTSIATRNFVKTNKPKISLADVMNNGDSTTRPVTINGASSVYKYLSFNGKYRNWVISSYGYYLDILNVTDGYTGIRLIDSNIQCARAISSNQATTLGQVNSLIASNSASKIQTGTANITSTVAKSYTFTASGSGPYTYLSASPFDSASASVFQSNPHYLTNAGGTNTITITFLNLLPEGITLKFMYLAIKQ